MLLGNEIATETGRRVSQQQNSSTEKKNKEIRRDRFL